MPEPLRYVNVRHLLPGDNALLTSRSLDGLRRQMVVMMASTVCGEGAGHAEVMLEPGVIIQVSGDRLSVPYDIRALERVESLTDEQKAKMTEVPFDA